MHDDKPFNMSEAFLLSLMDLRKSISSFAVNGELFAWFRGCMDFWNMIYFELSEEENTNIEETIKEVKAALNAPATKEGQQMFKAKISSIEDKLNLLTRNLFVFLNNHERIFLKSKYSTWQDEVKEDFS